MFGQALAAWSTVLRVIFEFEPQVFPRDCQPIERLLNTFKIFTFRVTFFSSRMNAADIPLVFFLVPALILSLASDFSQYRNAEISGVSP